MMNRPGYPKKLYKYRAFNVFALSALTQASTFYADPRRFNDPLDCDPTIEVDVGLEQLKRILRRQVEHYENRDQAYEELSDYGHMCDSRCLENDQAYHKQIIAVSIKHVLAEEMGKKGVFSMAEQWDCPLMWSHYGDEHRGICIEYDTTDFDHPFLQPVNYDAPRSIRTSELYEWREKMSPEAKKKVFDSYFLTKASQWRYEREWRDVDDRNGAHPTKYKITAVYLGLRCDPAVLVTIVKLLRNQDIELFEIYPRDDSFGLERRAIETEEVAAMGIRSSPYFDFKDVILPNA
jgi:Protein of unknown function (DUF2971)